ncbi:hypothetical protein F5X68DRAFT_32925 [Plectosphaerella plurivora]|uniref:Uncharacterized protein n=1 Tax=Plectosphaerella plurivora TaxID=936078 RepID=A0A9P9A7Q2_9PEZI|nr:hypothetical protein F5X68DRAFT_32925 [Plectosphaerella plurivora]
MQETACMPQRPARPPARPTRTSKASQLDPTRLDNPTLCSPSTPPVPVAPRTSRRTTDTRHACIENLSWGALARTGRVCTKYLTLISTQLVVVCCMLLSRLRPHRPSARLTRPPSLVVWYLLQQFDPTDSAAVGVNVQCPTALVRAIRTRPPDNNTGRTRMNPVVPASYWSRKDLGLPSSHLSQRTAPPETLFLHACPHLRSSIPPSIHLARQYGSPLLRGKIRSSATALQPLASAPSMGRRISAMAGQKRWSAAPPSVRRSGPTHTTHPRTHGREPSLVARRPSRRNTLVCWMSVRSKNIFG